MPNLIKQRSLRVRSDEADAIARGVSAELKSPALFDRIERVYFDRPSGGLLERARRDHDETVTVRSTVSDEGDRALVEVISARDEALEIEDAEVPRSSLRFALRGATARELWPSIVEGVHPSLTVHATRERFFGAGWEVEVLRDVRFARPGEPSSENSDGASPWCAVVITERSGALPVWLNQLSLGMTRYHEWVDGVHALEDAGLPKPEIGAPIPLREVADRRRATDDFALEEGWFL